ncbi:type II secretion system protein GspD, partial [Acinetobacter baumannii]|nr:type II secretion system protein GspD [Acinetobacter baumannii]
NTGLPGLGNSITGLTATAATTALPSGVTSAAAAAGALTPGLNIGWLKNMFGITGLGALLQAFSGTTDANVLSTPNLVTLDNEEAKIVVGQN